MRPRQTARSRAPVRPNYRLVAGLALAGLLGSLFLALVLSDRPDAARLAQTATDPGGVTTVAKSPPRPTRITREAATPEVAPVVSTTPATEAVRAAEPAIAPQASPSPVVEPSPSVRLPTLGQTVSIPKPVQSPPLPVRAPQAAPVAAPAPAPALPWRVGTSQESESRRVANSQPQNEPVAAVRLPSRSDLRSWIRSSAREFVGGVDADGMPLYRFELWLETPDDMRNGIRTVSYEYRAPSAQPPEQSSTEAESGFRVKFGAAACAETATVTVVMNDGRERSISVDGCKILN